MFGILKPVLGGTTRMMETTGAYDGGAVGMDTGIFENTMIATDLGWRPIGSVVVGDKVLTFDHGLKVVKAVHRNALWTGGNRLPRKFQPVEVPAGALGNTHTMHLLPNQLVMVESDSAEDCFGDPFALVPAAALDGLAGIHRVPMQDAGDVISLQFEQDEVVFAMCGGLFFCNSGGDIFQDLFRAPQESDYTTLGLEDAKSLVLMIKDEVETANFKPFAMAA